MKQTGCLKGCWSAALALLSVLVLSGCRSSGPVYAEFPPQEPVGEVTSPNPFRNAGNRFQVGDSILVTFAGGGNETLPRHEERVKENGTITLHLIGPIKAEGKTAGELQLEIHTNYVPRLYPHLIVTVEAAERMYFVGGEVRAPGPQFYRGPTTVLKAIQSAGDFTDFANKRNVQVTRVNGETIQINCLNALRDPALDIPVYSGDKIYVRRRWL